MAFCPIRPKGIEKCIAMENPRAARLSMVRNVETCARILSITRRNLRQMEGKRELRARC